MTRLLKSVYPGEEELVLDWGLDFAAGDMLGLAATNSDPWNSETVTLASYDVQSGIAKLLEPAEGYHFGASQSTGSDYSGVDMRGEVMLLSSNVRITASDDDESRTRAHPEAFGCQVIVSDFFEPHDLTYRAGSIYLDSISMYNCAQENTTYAGLRFDNAVQGVKKVSNSAISSGRGNGIILKKSRNVELTDNVIHDFARWGIYAESSADFKIKGNIINGITPEKEDFPTYKKWDEINGAAWFKGC